MKFIWKHIIIIAYVCGLSAATVSAQINFIENQGQWNSAVEFKTNIHGASVFAQTDRILYNLYESDLKDYLHPIGKDLPPKDLFWSHAYEVVFENCNAITPKGQKELPFYHNYFIGSDPSKWAQGVNLFEKIYYEDLFEGVDMIMYQGGNSLKYDFIIHPYEDPSQISMTINGADEVKLVNEELHVGTKVNTVIESEPYTYQFIDGKIITIPCRYVLDGNKITFELGKYNPAYKLIIDPELILATTTGSAESNFGFTATYDQDENLIAGGNVFALGFPVTLGALQSNFGGDYSDSFITKFNDTGSDLLYATYLGGSENERPHSLITTLDNDIYVLGTTGSTNFPVTAGAHDTSFNGGTNIDIATSLGDHDNGSDLYVAKINGVTGALTACTYVGGSGNDGLNFSTSLEYNYADAFRGEIIVEDDEEIIITTTTASSDFPVLSSAAQSTYGGGSTDAVVFKMSMNLNAIQWSTYVGGTGDDSGYSVQPDSEGNFFVVGGTTSFNLPVTAGTILGNNPGQVSGYVVKLDQFGTEVLAGSYVGTVSYDQAYFVQLDLEDNVYVVGQTTGNYPIEGNVYSNPNSGQFIHKYDNNLSSTFWSTRVGSGSGGIDISPTAFLVSDCNKIFLTGWGGETNSNFGNAILSTTVGLPITADAYQSTTDGSDFYLMVLEEEASGLLYGTYFGGGTSREHVDGGTSKFSKDGVVYQAVCSGCGGNSDFPTTSSAWSQNNNTTNCDLGVFKFNLGRANVEIGLDAPDQVCLNEEFQLNNLSDQELSIEWDFGNNETSDQDTPTVSYDEAGVYTISLTGNDNTGCLDGNVDQVTVEVIGNVDPQIEVPSSICEGETITVVGTGTENASWNFNPVIPDADELEFTISPTENVTLELSDFNECSSQTVSASIEIDVLEIEITAPEEICLGTEITVQGTGGATFEWINSDGEVLGEGSSLTFSPEETMDLTLYSATAGNCDGEETVSIIVVENAPGGEQYDPIFVCENEEITLTANPASTWLWTPGGFETQSILISPLENTEYSVFMTNVCGSGTDAVEISVGAAEATAMAPDSICFDDEIALEASGGLVYAWRDLNLNEQLSTNIVSPEVTTNYQVTVTDLNGCQDSAITTVFVLPLPYVDAGPNIEVMFLDTAILQGSTTEESYWWSSHPDLSCQTCLDPTVYPSENHWYFLNAVDEFGCKNYDGVLVEVTGPLYVPNSFTPNGDGVNDVFRANGLLVSGFKMQIFNRWGELIFETTDPEIGWDGTYKGFPPIMDTYTWRVEYKDYKYGRKVAVGHVTLIN